MRTVADWDKMLPNATSYYSAHLPSIRRVLEGDTRAVDTAFVWANMPLERNMRWSEINNGDDMTDDERNLVLALYLKAMRENH